MSFRFDPGLFLLQLLLLTALSCLGLLLILGHFRLIDDSLSLFLLLRGRGTAVHLIPMLTVGRVSASVLFQILIIVTVCSVVMIRNLLVVITIIQCHVLLLPLYVSYAL